MADSRQKGAPDASAVTPSADQRQKDFTRRALIRAGWTVPLVTTINIPEASAQTPAPHNDVHGDSPHTDETSVHLDVHLDSRLPIHSDFSDHTDTPHTDAPHTDVPHTDVPHTDAPHTDTPAHTGPDPIWA
jgi:hypothetical protein